MSKARKFENAHEIVERLCGMIDPVGESHVDEIRLDNLEDTIILTEELIEDILRVSENKYDHHWSVSVAGHRAERFKNELFERLSDLNKLNTDCTPSQSCT